jgi:hypothetical protein
VVPGALPGTSVLLDWVGDDENREGRPEGAVPDRPCVRDG